MMANWPLVREQLARNSIAIPQDTYFIAGQHNTTTDDVELFDLEDLPPTHRKDLLQLVEDLEIAGKHASQERCSRFPELKVSPRASRAQKEVHRRSSDWSQVRPEWGLSGNAAFIVGRRALTRGIPLNGRVFLHSYDYLQDPHGRLLEVILTGPQLVGQWINMEHYFSAVDPEVYGSGSKIYHNIVGRLGIMIQGDEPMITPEMIDAALEPLRSTSCVNLVHRITSQHEFMDPNTIKVVADLNGNALYFSRAPIPHVDFENTTTKIFKQVCVIGFTRECLQEFPRLAPTPLERTESIDMLRLLEHGRSVRVVETDVTTHSVDTPADLQLVEKMMKR